ncbi:MAG: hypothetical protein HKO56_07250 [Bacteroidia bacterium]|nr:hypothetical protein [Bacteroidia bacterium]NNC85747.1 hypothetical protein [Bacteroidia bacterium]NNM16437.1 hypothetical protein [Bacteroidia bacterium]
MKKVLFIIFFLFPVIAFSQQVTYYYSFSVVGIKTEAQAKSVAENLYDMFDIMPVFNKDLKKFDFASSVNIEESRLKKKIKVYGFQIQNFKKSLEPPTKE